MSNDVQWLTYEEAAAALNIDADSVKRRAQRSGWPRMPGNDRRVRIGVPVELMPTGDMSGDASSPEDRDALIGRLLDDLATLREENAALRQRLAAAETAREVLVAEARFLSRRGLAARLRRIGELRFVR